MEQHKENWIDDILNSAEGINSAIPSFELKQNLNYKLFKQNSKPVSPILLKVASIAAMIIICLNVMAAFSYFNSTSLNSSQAEISNSTQSLISNYKIYQ